MSAGLWLYHRAPYPLKVAIAAARGLQIRRRRFGRETDAAVAAAQARERWSPAEWLAWRGPRLEAYLARAATRVPHYREHGPTSDVTQLAAWPILDKASVRSHPDSFLADDRPVGRLLLSRTSGTTGSPMRLWWSRDTLRAWHVLYESRIRHWNGVSRHDRWGILGGQLVTSSQRARPPFWVWNPPMRQLYLSVYHIRPATVASYVAAMHAHELKYLLGYPSALAAVADLATHAGVEPPPIRVVITNAEPLLARQRRSIEAYFGCPVRDTYGMAEGAAGASECEAGALHLWPEAGVVEVLDREGRPCEYGDVGRLVLTGLLHDAMPLVRYEIGDRGALAPPDEACACGRTLPRVARIEGRADDVLRTQDGTLVGRLDPIFKDDLAIREAQIIQTQLDEIVILVVPEPNWKAEGATTLTRRVRERMGPVRVDVRTVESIPRDANGKFRAVISQVKA